MKVNPHSKCIRKAFTCSLFIFLPCYVSQVTYICFWWRQAELDEAYLRLLHASHAAAFHPLVQHQTLHQLAVVDGAAGKNKTYIYEINIKGEYISTYIWDF